MPSVQLSLCGRTPTHGHALHVHSQNTHTNSHAHPRRHKLARVRACVRALHHAVVSMRHSSRVVASTTEWRARSAGARSRTQAYEVVRWMRSLRLRIRPTQTVRSLVLRPPTRGSRFVGLIGVQRPSAEGNFTSSTSTRSKCQCPNCTRPPQSGKPARASWPARVPSTLGSCPLPVNRPGRRCGYYYY